MSIEFSTYQCWICKQRKEGNPFYKTISPFSGEFCYCKTCWTAKPGPALFFARTCAEELLKDPDDNRVIQAVFRTIPLEQLVKDVAERKCIKTGAESYPANWKHCIIHLNPSTGEMHSDGDHSVRNWIQERMQPSHIPWWRKDKFGWQIETYKGKRFKSFVRIVFQNIRKLTP